LAEHRPGRREPNTPLPARILLADCDSYFVRCAQIADPEGAGRAEYLIVGGSAKGRGVVTSASYAARAFGVHAGMPSSQAIRLCPMATFAPVPGEVVRQKHHEVRAVLERWAPVVQAASVDEFYLDMTGTELLYHDEPLEETARRMQQEVWDETEISISVGGATNRLLAKMAASVNKPRGVFVVPPGGEAEFMLRWEMADIPGVGPSLTEALRRRGVATVRQGLAIDLETLASWVGPSRAEWLWEVMRGEHHSGPVSPRQRQKSVSHERTFGEDISDDRELHARLLSLAALTGSSLRAEGMRGRTITVRIRYGDFTDRQASHTLPEPVESDVAIAREARALLRRLRSERGGPVRLLGVGISGLVRPEEVEASLFPDAPGGPETERERRLSAAADRLRERFGADAVRSAGAVRTRRPSD
jgi:DNA polymerase IV